MRLLPTPSPGFLFSPRSESEAPKLLVSAALLLCDCSEEKERLFASPASVRLRRAGDAPGVSKQPGNAYDGPNLKRRDHDGENRA
ncbi:unnamed protein product [Rangifer tarandus platyrhynchus]|uniref:Uncharacterized protein n=2 Tax=Rangifer tarandus platyrhynchus TaxID=3082113 RepID=A0ACB0DRF8_RANTA|nr:unnamed protein product [Rangifer tarandus platyrhynchus]CAI9690813.1 unnamed protein product [Rangifer tarandus platyrhynchus]